MFYTSGSVSGIVRSISQTEDKTRVSVGQLTQEETLAEGAVCFLTFISSNEQTHEGKKTC